MDTDAILDVGGARAASSRRRASASRGLTLVEVLIVIAVLTMLMGGMMMGMGQLQRSHLKGSATRVAAAMRSAYQRASSTGRQVRMVVDIDAGKIWLEESSDVMLLKTDDLSGNGGASPATEAERAASAEANRIAAGVQVARAMFSPVKGPAGQPQALYSGIQVRSVDAAHVSAPKTAGHGYVYFFGSEAERASVQLMIAGGDPETDVFSVVLSPLTGKATISDKAVAVAHPRDDAEASDAEDNSGF